VVTKYIYDSNNSCIKEVAEGLNDFIANYTIQYSYDDKNRCTEKCYEYGSNKEVTQYEYDDNDKCIREIYTSTFMDKESTKSTTEYTYDENGNCIKKVKSFSYGGTETTEYVYDANNRIQSSRERILYPEQNRDNDIVITYTYDKEGNLVSEREERTDTTNSYSNVVTSERFYCCNGRLLEKEITNNPMNVGGNEEKYYTYEEIQYFYQAEDRVVEY